MNNDVRIERIEELRTYSLYLENISESLYINFKEFDNNTSLFVENLKQLENSLDEKRSHAYRLLEEMEKMLSEKDGSDVFQFHKLKENISLATDISVQMNREISKAVEIIQHKKRIIGKLIEDLNNFRNNYSNMIETGQNVVNNSINSINEYHSLNN